MESKLGAAADNGEEFRFPLGVKEGMVFAIRRN
jgi:hypothetical protein